MKTQNYFHGLEKEVRGYLADPQVRTKVLEDLVQNVLRQMVKPRSYSRGMTAGVTPPAPVSSIEFSGAILEGVSAVILDELGEKK
tara:strand:- start:981 stop:1235 length:255 start_codon:yes stop_codon:yes gene_type:complete